MNSKEFSQPVLETSILDLSLGKWSPMESHLDDASELTQSPGADTPSPTPDQSADPSVDPGAVPAVHDLDAAFDRVIPEDLKSARIKSSDPNSANASVCVSIAGMNSELDGMMSLAKTLSHRRQRRETGRPMGMTSGLATLDVEIGGLAYGSTTLITGPPGSGKSSLAKQILDGANESEEDTLGFFVAPGDNIDEIRFRTLTRLARSHGVGDFTTDSLRNGLGMDAAEARLELLAEKSSWLSRQFVFGPSLGRLDGDVIVAMVQKHLALQPEMRPLIVIDHMNGLEGSESPQHHLASYQALLRLVEATGGHAVIVMPFVRTADRHSDGSEKRDGPAEVISRCGILGLEAPLILALSTGQSTEGCVTVVKDRLGRTPRRVLLRYDSSYATFSQAHGERSHEAKAPPPRMKHIPALTPEPIEKSESTVKVAPQNESKTASIRRGNENSVKTEAKPASPPIPSPTTEPSRSPLRPKRWRSQG